MKLVLVLAGGAIGSGARYLTSLGMVALFGASFPWGTLTVNVTGSFLIGIIATLADEHHALSPEMRALLVAGLLGGFTTFSALSLETLRLTEEGAFLAVILNVLGNVAIGLTAVFLGVAVGRALDI